MSRSLNRALIESSLEMKCMFFFGIALSLVFLMSFMLYRWAMSAQIMGQNADTANVWATQHLREKHREYFADNPTPDALTDSLFPMYSSSPDGIKLEFRRFMESVSERIRNRDSYWEYIPYPAKPVDPTAIGYDPDGVAKEEEARQRYAPILEKFKPHIKEDYQPVSGSERFEQYYDSETGTYEYFEEVRMDRKSVCVDCHSELHGELRGVQHVVIPHSSTKKLLEKYWAYMFSIAIISVFLAIVTVLIVIRWIVIRPLHNLRDVAESISRGDLAKRAEINTGDEFAVLGEAFNRMLRHLINTQDMLRKANNDLESKVDELAHLTIQLYETNRVKSDFMATMSHELRTPLNSILGFSDVLSSISALNDKQKRYVENINKSGRSLLSMINDILDMAKMEAGRMGVQPMQFNIATTIAAQCDMAKPLVDRKNIDLQAIVEEDLPPMKQDESRIQQIINNLLSNAIKFTPEGGRIKLFVHRLPAVPLPVPPVSTPVGGAAVKPSRNRDMLELKIADTGVGISEEDQQFIFEKFRQGKSASPEGDTMKREHSGSGLGLSIVKEICKMLEGEISVESQLGIGSTFTVRLPWTLESKARAESEMLADIQQFAQNRIVKGRIEN